MASSIFNKSCQFSWSHCLPLFSFVCGSAMARSRKSTTCVRTWTQNCLSQNWNRWTRHFGVHICVKVHKTKRFKSIDLSEAWAFESQLGFSTHSGTAGCWTQVTKGKAENSSWENWCSTKNNCFRCAQNIQLNQKRWNVVGTGTIWPKSKADPCGRSVVTPPGIHRN